MDKIRFLHMQAERCRESALEAATEHARRGLEQLARHYEQEARKLNLEQIQASQY